MTARGGEAPVVAAGPTDLRRFVPYSLLVTGAVFVLPLWIAFGLGPRIGAVATVLSLATAIALGHLGSALWQRHPGSRDVVFNDLMAWGFVRRMLTQRRLVRKVERLGLDAKNTGLSVEQRTELLKDLAVALETGDPYTHGHSQRVARHAYMVAKSMKLPRRVTEKIRLAGVIHDVGKLKVPREIITKPGRLTDDEFAVVKTHTTLGAEMVEMIGDHQVTDMVRHHHERLDGSGYPDALKGDELSIGARILAVADTFDAASSLRPYRAAQKHKVALNILATEASAERLDAKVVDAFTAYYSGRRGMRWWVVLSTSPRHVYELVLLVLQRLGATSVASAAVVGATAMALGPGLPQQITFDEPSRPRPRAESVTLSERSSDHAGLAGTAATTGRDASSSGLTRSRRARAAAHRRDGSHRDGRGPARDGTDAHHGRPKNDTNPKDGKDPKGPKGPKDPTGEDIPAVANATPGPHGSGVGSTTKDAGGGKPSNSGHGKDDGGHPSQSDGDGGSKSDDDDSDEENSGSDNSGGDNSGGNNSGGNNSGDGTSDGDQSSGADSGSSDTPGNSGSNGSGNSNSGGGNSGPSADSGGGSSSDHSGGGNSGSTSSDAGHGGGNSGNGNGNGNSKGKTRSF